MAQNKRPDADGLAALSFWAQLNPADFVFVERLNGGDDRAATAGDAITA